MKTSRAPMMAGFGVALAFVVGLGNQTVNDEIRDRVSDNPWMRSLGGGEWRLTTDGRPFDLFLTLNAFVIVYLISLFVLLWVLLPKVTQPSVAVATAWGATVAAGLFGAAMRGLLAVVTDNPVFSPFFDNDVLTNVSGSIEFASSYVLWSGLWIGLAAGIAFAVTSGSAPPAVVGAPPYPTGGQSQPPPAFVAPTAPAPAPAVGGPAQTPPPIDPTQAPPPGSF